MLTRTGPGRAVVHAGGSLSTQEGAPPGSPGRQQGQQGTPGDGSGRQSNAGPAGSSGKPGSGGGEGKRDAPPAGRITVDVRGTNLHANNYSIYVKQQPAAIQNVELGVRSVTNSLASLGGVLVTVLTIHKLVEEIRLMRLLRR